MSEEYVYVVTRNNRRTEPCNYVSLTSAQSRANALRDVLKRFDPSDVKNVNVVRTKKPNQIR